MMDKWIDDLLLINKCIFIMDTVIKIVMSYVTQFTSITGNYLWNINFISLMSNTVMDYFVSSTFLTSLGVFKLETGRKLVLLDETNLDIGRTCKLTCGLNLRPYGCNSNSAVTVLQTEPPGHPIMSFVAWPLAFLLMIMIDLFVCF